LVEIESSPLEEWTKYTYKIMLKKFLKTIGREDIAKYIKPRIKQRNKLKRSDLLTMKEIIDMIEATNNPMYKALIITMYEGGVRAGELLGMKVKDVIIKGNITLISVQGKTGIRTIPLILATPYLQKYLEKRETKKPDEPLWINQYGRPLEIRALEKSIREIAARVGITKKVYPHLFRHTRYTHLAPKLAEAILKKLFGWTLSSRMPSVYAHLVSEDVETAMLKLYGIKTDGDTLHILCPRCKEINIKDAKTCIKCGYNFIRDETEKWILLEEKIHKLEEKIEQLLKKNLSDFNG
jgi:integrase